MYHHRKPQKFFVRELNKQLKHYLKRNQYGYKNFDIFAKRKIKYLPLYELTKIGSCDGVNGEDFNVYFTSYDSELTKLLLRFSFVCDYEQFEVFVKETPGSQKY